MFGEMQSTGPLAVARGDDMPPENKPQKPDRHKGLKETGQPPDRRGGLTCAPEKTFT